MSYILTVTLVYKLVGSIVQLGKAHVWSGTHGGTNGPLLGFVQTKPSDTGCRQVFALDCELLFTTMGLEVARVSLANVDGSSQYDALFQPEHEIIDFNTRFSGVTKEDYVLYKAKTLKQAQYGLLHYIESDTILVGHGIENDLRALKIVHTLVVDTTAIFPHEHGLPCRRSLKSLAQEYLRKNIQTSATGHDSLEDARIMTCSTGLNILPKVFLRKALQGPAARESVFVGEDRRCVYHQGVDNLQRPKIVLDAVPYEDRVTLDVVEQAVLGLLQSFRLVQASYWLDPSTFARDTRATSRPIVVNKSSQSRAKTWRHPVSEGLVCTNPSKGPFVPPWVPLQTWALHLVQPSEVGRYKWRPTWGSNPRP
ncbi:hypothetical protein J6590_092323 [Homalodisca vitripennis]|nr:hypothetical protein J6590_092323 [Homalodisca vitripennis]